MSETGSNPTIFWYQGQAWWKLTIGGRTYYISPARIYDVEDGRFLQRDPLRRLAGAYRYVAGDAINVVDPRGLRGSRHGSPIRGLVEMEYTFELPKLPPLPIPPMPE